MWIKGLVALCMIVVNVYGQGLQTGYPGGMAGRMSLSQFGSFGPTQQTGHVSSGFSQFGGQMSPGFDTSSFDTSGLGGQVVSGGTPLFGSGSRFRLPGRLGQSVGGSFGGMHGGQGIPADVLAVIGSTRYGREITGGEFGTPAHGGAGAGEQFANGITRSGWDGNPATRHRFGPDPWASPIGNHPVPRGFDGNIDSIRHLMIG